MADDADKPGEVKSRRTSTGSEVPAPPRLPTANAANPPPPPSADWIQPPSRDVSTASSSNFGPVRRARAQSDIWSAYFNRLAAALYEELEADADHKDEIDDRTAEIADTLVSMAHVMERASDRVEANGDVGAEAVKTELYFWEGGQKYKRGESGRAGLGVAD